jgi:CBS domain-containing protein
MLVKDMISDKVILCTFDDDVAKVRNILDLRKISALPVASIKDGKAVLEGIVTYQDLAGVYDDTINIRQIMTSHVFAVTLDTSTESAAKIMLDKMVHHLVVMDGDDIAGILSSFDYVRLAAEE